MTIFNRTIDGLDGLNGLDGFKLILIYLNSQLLFIKSFKLIETKIENLIHS